MSDSKSVFLVTSGEYSDYSINAAFSTRDDAEAFADRRNRARTYGSDFRVEELELDTVTVKHKTDHIAFKVSLTHPPFMFGSGWHADGNPDHDTLPFEDVRKELFERHYPDRGTHAIFTTWVWALDHDSALKIGADRIMQTVAAQEDINVSSPFPEDDE